MSALRASIPFAIALFAPSPRALAQCELERLTASDVMSRDRFGASVALDGNSVAVGATGISSSQGRAFVYSRTPTGWGDEVLITPSTGSPANRFGFDVALRGDTLTVSATAENASGVLDSGAVYVFERAGSDWTQVDKLTASDPAMDDFFGASLGLEGDLLFAGAWTDDAGEDSGSVYVFERSPSGWTEVQKLTASDAAADARFGSKLDFDGTRLVVLGGGAAYVFEELAGVWTETARLSPVNGQFVTSVAVDGDAVLVGAIGFCTKLGCDAGDAFVFEFGPGGWTEVAHLVSSEGSSEQEFGSAVDIDGDRALVGTLGYYYKGTQYASGAAHVFERVGTVWTRTTKLTSPAQHFNDRYGSEVSLQGRTAVVGAFKDLGSRGAAYVFGILDSVETYCFGVGCPCSNSLTSAGCGNSTAPQFLENNKGGHLGACGSTSAADDDLVLILRNLPVHEFGLLYMGAGMTQAVFGDGLRCVNAGGVDVFRYPIQDAGAGGTITLGPGIVAASHADFPGGAIAAGQTWNFQGWYRDPAGHCGSGFNLTNAASVTFGP